LQVDGGSSKARPWPITMGQEGNRKPSDYFLGMTENGLNLPEKAEHKRENPSMSTEVSETTDHFQY